MSVFILVWGLMVFRTAYMLTRIFVCFTQDLVAGMCVYVYVCVYVCVCVCVYVCMCVCMCVCVCVSVYACACVRVEGDGRVICSHTYVFVSRRI